MKKCTELDAAADVSENEENESLAWYWIKSVQEDYIKLVGEKNVDTTAAVVGVFNKDGIRDL